MHFAGPLLLGVFCCFATTAVSQTDQLVASDTARLLWFNTGMYERDFALSPDGSLIYYTLQMPGGGIQTIVEMKRTQNGRWSAPTVASFAGKYSDLEPAFSPDGNKLFFVSNRPVDGSGIKDFDIWVTSRQADGSWGPPQNLGAPVNGSGNEYYPAVTRSGNLYFTATVNNGAGKEDIVVSEWKDGKYQTPHALDSNVNTSTYEFNAFVSADEQWIVFSSYGRKDDLGGGDLYISKKKADGKWQPARNLKLINSDKIDYCPFISPDGKSFFYTSEKSALPAAYIEKPVTYRQLVSAFTGSLNGGGNIYIIRFESILKSLTDFQSE